MVQCSSFPCGKFLMRKGMVRVRFLLPGIRSSNFLFICHGLQIKCIYSLMSASYISFPTKFSLFIIVKFQDSVPIDVYELMVNVKNLRVPFNKSVICRKQTAKTLGVKVNNGSLIISLYGEESVHKLFNNPN